MRPERGHRVPFDVLLVLHLREQFRQKVFGPMAIWPHQVAGVNDEGTAIALLAVDPDADIAAEGRDYAHLVGDCVERGGDLGAVGVGTMLRSTRRSGFGSGDGR